MAKSDIWMPLYIGDYLADTMHLSTEEHGAYLLLLMAIFKAGGSINLDETTFAILTRLPEERWVPIEKKMLRFFNISEGVLTHDRVMLEIEAAKEKSKKGAKGAAKRWGNATDIPEDMPEGCPDPCPDPCSNDARSIAPQSQSQSHSHTTTTNPDSVVVEIQEALIRCGVTSAKAAESAIAAGGPGMTLEAIAWLEGQRVAGVLPFAPAVIYGRLTQAGRATLPASQGWDDKPSDEYLRAVAKSKQATRKLREVVERIPIPELTARHGPWADGLDMASERVKLERENQVWRMEPDSKVRVELMRRKEMEVRSDKAEAG